MKNEIILQKMQVYTNKVINYCSGCTYDSFTADTKLVEACVFNLIQLGELCHSVDEVFIQTHSEIPWHAIYGLRNRIVHNYEGVNLKLVWEIISEDLPELKNTLQNLINQQFKTG